METAATNKSLRVIMRTFRREKEMKSSGEMFRQTAGHFEFAERRTIIAHGETVGGVVQSIQAPAGAAENKPMIPSVASAGACVFYAIKPRLAVLKKSLQDI
jgi:hypothetical protein